MCIYTNYFFFFSQVDAADRGQPGLPHLPYLLEPRLVPEAIAQRRRGCSLFRVRVNGVIIHLRSGGYSSTPQGL